MRTREAVRVETEVLSVGLGSQQLGRVRELIAVRMPGNLLDPGVEGG
jgi:hypothetical protein